MSEQVKTKKKLSTFGKVWIIVCVVAMVLSVLVPTLPMISDYNNHTHYRRCYTESGHARYLDCSYSFYDNALSYAVEYIDIGYIVYIARALGAANVIMLILYFVRRAMAKVAAKAEMQEANSPIAAVSIPTGEGEQVVLTRQCVPLFPYFLIVLGFAAMVLGIILLIDWSEVWCLLLACGGLLLLILGIITAQCKLQLTVTTKRVIYKGIFWRRMNLPLNRISAVDTAIFGTLHVGSSAGHIIMGFFRHYREVYDTINALLAQME